MVDLARALDDGELAALRKLNAAGVNVVVSWPCYAANAGLRKAWGVRKAGSGSLRDSLVVGEAWQGSLRVPEMGRARVERMVEFVDLKAGELERILDVSELGGDGWEAVARRKSTGGASIW